MTVASGLPNLFDVGINGQGFLVAWEVPVLHHFASGPFKEEGDDLQIQRRDTTGVEKINENKIDRLVWHSQRDWSGGAGQLRYDASQLSRTDAFYSSKGVDVFGTISNVLAGQATLLPSTVDILSLSNSAPGSPRVMVATDNYVYQSAGGGSLRRFSQLDGSDIATVAVGASARSTLSLATDGSVVYAAQQADGIYQANVGTDTQREAFDATAGFTVANGTQTADTTVKTEGTASIKLNATRASNGTTTATDRKTLAGAPLDLSGQDAITWWLRYHRNSSATITGTRTITQKLQLSSDVSPTFTNYFERSFDMVAGANSLTEDLWRIDNTPRSSFTSVGAPDWTQIRQVRIVNVITLTGYSSGTDDVDMWFDDLRTQVSGSFLNDATHGSTHDARVLGWAKDRLFAGGLKGGSTTQWEFFEPAPAGADTIRLTLPDGFSISAIAELGGFVYFSANRNTRSVIYKYDGTNTPSVAAPLPNGEQVTMMTPFLNAGMLIGAHRIGNSSSTGGQGVLYRAFSTASGDLALERILTIGRDDGRDYYPKVGVSYGDFVYFAWSAFGSVFGGGPGTTTGIGVYNPVNGGFAQHLSTPSGRNNIEGLVVFKGRKIFTVAASGTYVEQYDTSGNPVYLSSGQIVSSVMDWEIDGVKFLPKAEVGTLALPSANQTVTLEYSTDFGTTWTTSVTESGSGATQAAAFPRISFNHIQYRLTLTTTDTSQTPALKKAGFGAFYGTKPQYVYNVAVKAYDRMTAKNGTPFPIISGYSAQMPLSRQVAQFFKDLRDNQTTFDFQPPGYNEFHTDTFACRIGNLRIMTKWEPGSGWASIVWVELVRLPS